MYDICAVARKVCEYIPGNGSVKIHKLCYLHRPITTKDMIEEYKKVMERKQHGYERI